MEHTKGKAIIRRNHTNCEIILDNNSPYSERVSICTTGNWIGKAIPEMEANAELICEAFNVANETGKTPRQLTDENKELLEACIKAFDILNTPYKDWQQAEWEEAVQLSRAAIHNATK